MTTWGCTPLCRGFDRHGGFYNAFNDYFTYQVGPGLDLRLDFAPDNATAMKRPYSTDLYADRAIDWITGAVGAGAKNSFGYLAFQAIHAPQEAPADLVTSGFCADSIPASAPVRRIACGQMRSVDANVARVVAAYKALGIWESTMLVFTADNVSLNANHPAHQKPTPPKNEPEPKPYHLLNLTKQGGNTDTGGSNWPLRGAKATMFEGGMRGAAFVSGAGLEAVAGTVSHAFYSLTDWLPTIAGSIAGVDLALAAEPKYAFQPPPPPLDGIDIWASLSTGGPSPRTSALLYLDPFNCFTGAPPVPCRVPGQGALRAGNYKIISGHVGAYMSKTTNVSTQFCGAQDGQAPPNSFPLPVTPATSPPFCPAGWVRYTADAPGAAVIPPPEEAGPGGSCTSTPCRLPSVSPLLAGGVWLFDVVNDPLETTNLAPSMPALAAQLLAQLQAINATNVPQSHSPNDPASSPKNFGGVWTPWRGNPAPAACDPNATRDTVDSNFDGVTFSANVARLQGWCWSPQAAGDGRGALNVSFRVDGVAAGGAVANLPRPPAFMNKTGAPNVEHGFDWVVPEPWASNITRGKHTVAVLIGAPDGSVVEARGSPVCIGDKNPTRCTEAD